MITVIIMFLEMFIFEKNIQTIFSILLKFSEKVKVQRSCFGKVEIQSIMDAYRLIDVSVVAYKNCRSIDFFWGERKHIV